MVLDTIREACPLDLVAHTKWGLLVIHWALVCFLGKDLAVVLTFME